MMSLALFPHRPGVRLLLASEDGRGFTTSTARRALAAQTRAGKQVLTPAAGRYAPRCACRRTAIWPPLSATTAACWWSISPRSPTWRAAAA